MLWTQTKDALWNQGLGLLPFASVENIYIKKTTTNEEFTFGELEAAIWLSCTSPTTTSDICTTIRQRLPAFRNESQAKLERMVRSTLAFLIEDKLIQPLSNNYKDTTSHLNKKISCRNTTEGLPAHLFTVSWNWTNACNFSCKHCYSRTEKYNAELNTDESLNAVDQLWETGVFNVHFGGGECILRKDFLQILAATSAKGIKTQLTSNGWHIPSIADRLRLAGLNVLNLSLDSHEPDAHDQLREQPGSFKKVILAIKASKEAGLKVNIISMLHAGSIDSIRRIIDLSAENLVDTVEFKVIKEAGNALINKSCLLQPKELQRAYQELYNLKKEYSGIINVDFADKSEPLARVALEELGIEETSRMPSSNGGCFCGDLSLCLKPNGDVTPCSYMTLPIGNIRTSHLFDIWAKSPFLTDLRKLKALDDPACKSCKHLKTCKGGCMAHTLATSYEGKLHSKPDPNCWELT